MHIQVASQWIKKNILLVIHLNVKSWYTSQSVSNVGENCSIYRRVDIMKAGIWSVIYSEN